jgi:protein SCO1/2
MKLLVALIVCMGTCAASRASAAPYPVKPDATAPPAVMKDVGLEPKLGATVPRDVAFTDHRGRALTMGELLDGERPVILLLAYYRCPMLCGLTIDGMARGLGDLQWPLGEEFRVVTVSFDPRDGPADAERARVRAIETLGLDVDADDWPFLVGDEREVRRLADAVGFHYAYDERSDQYAHPSAVFVLTPDGTLSRLLYGFEYPALDLRLALVEAGRGQVGTVVEQVLVTCYRYDPAQRRYGFWVLGFLRLAGAVLLVTAGVGFFVLIRRDRRRMRALEGKE